MVAPVTGPFLRTITGLGPTTQGGFKPQWLEMNRTWRRQRRPYNLPLTFDYRRKEVLAHYKQNSGYDYVTVANCPGYYTLTPTQFFPNTYNKAYGRFVSKLKPDTAGLGINLVQRKQAIVMIANRALQLGRFVKQLKRFNFRRAASELGMDPASVKKLTLRKGSKHFGNNFLEFHFGWSPLIGDIYSSVDLLQNGVPPVRVTASSSGSYTSKYVDESSEPDLYRTTKGNGSWRIGAKVSVTNPNLFLANQLGLVNPALILYDAIPFSFVVNWFVNVEQFLSSFSDTWGLTLTDQYITGIAKVSMHEERWYNNYPTAGKRTPQWFADTLCVQMARTAGTIPGPTLRIRGPWTISPTRGLTAVSLLLQKISWKG